MVDTQSMSVNQRDPFMATLDSYLDNDDTEQVAAELTTSSPDILYRMRRGDESVTQPYALEPGIPPDQPARPPMGDPKSHAWEQWFQAELPATNGASLTFNPEYKPQGWVVTVGAGTTPEVQIVVGSGGSDVNARQIRLGAGGFVRIRAADMLTVINRTANAVDVFACAYANSWPEYKYSG